MKNIALIFLFISSSFCLANPVLLTSSDKQVGLLELYTSEGCSSCPPADRWLSSLKEEDELWKDFIPLAFHVDYWDYIGWKDRFASAQYSNRQRRYSREQSLKTVYTPGFVYNGKEWRNWFIRKFLDFPDGNKPGPLTLKIENDLINVTFKPTQNTNEKLIVNVALVGFDLVTQVKAGENRGRELSHDFVVLGVATAKTTKENGSYVAELNLPKTKISAPRYGIVAWLNNSKKQKPIQSVGGYLPSKIQTLPKPGL